MRNRNRRARHRVLIGARTLAAVLALGMGGQVAAGCNDDDDDEEAADTSPLPLVPRTGGRIEYSTIGASIRKPRRWTHRRGDRSLTLQSPDRAVIMRVSLPPGAERSAALLETAVAAVRRQYRGVEAIGADTRRIANRPASSVVTSATNARGARLRVLTSAVQGRRRAWLVQVFSAAAAKERRLAEAQVAIGTLRLTG